MNATTPLDLVGVDRTRECDLRSVGRDGRVTDLDSFGQELLVAAFEVHGPIDVAGGGPPAEPARVAARAKISEVPLGWRPGQDDLPSSVSGSTAPVGNTP